MAKEKYMFFNSIGEDRVYQADDFASYFRTFISDGVFQGGTALQVLPSNEGMSVTIKSGEAWIRGYAYMLDAPDGDEFLLDIAASDDLPRIDLVVLRLDLRTKSRKIEIAVKQGEPSGNPDRPLPEDSSNIKELSLAAIEIPANLTVIGTRHITDLRFSDECGVVTHLADIDVEPIYEHVQRIFREIDNMTSSYFREIDNMTSSYQEDLNAKSNDFQQQMAAEVEKVLDQGYISHTQLTEHKNNYHAHKYIDEGEDPDWADIEYKFRMIDGKPYMEVISNE